MVEQLSFQLEAGRDVTKELLLVDEDGAPVDLSGHVVRFGAERSGSAPDTADVISLDSTLGGVDVLDQVASPGRCNLVFRPADTDAFADETLDVELVTVDWLGKVVRRAEGRCPVLRRVI